MPQRLHPLPQPTVPGKARIPRPQWSCPAGPLPARLTAPAHKYTFRVFYLPRIPNFAVFLPGKPKLDIGQTGCYYLKMQAIFFDAFGTLCEIREKRNPYKPIIKAWPSGIADAYQVLMTRNSSPAALAREAGCTRDAIQKIEEGIAAEVASMRLYPEVPAVLRAIKKCDMQWAIVSNLAAPYAEPLLRLLPFTPDACAWSFAVGCRKPEEGIYRHACEALDIKPSSVLMVGDSLENDYNVPKQLGMQARYLRRDGVGTGKNIPECVADLSEIFQLGALDDLLFERRAYHPQGITRHVF
jgi:HAD superfamily hydrolase (TIGR01549 family)